MEIIYQHFRTAVQGEEATPWGHVTPGKQSAKFDTDSEAIAFTTGLIDGVQTFWPGFRMSIDFTFNGHIAIVGAAQRGYHSVSVKPRGSRTRVIRYYRRELLATTVLAVMTGEHDFDNSTSQRPKF